MSDAMCDLMYEDDSAQWIRAIERAVAARQFQVARLMAAIGADVTAGKSKWQSGDISRVIDQINDAERGYSLKSPLSPVDTQQTRTQEAR